MTILDLSNLIDNSMGDDDFVREMISMFVTQGRSQIIFLEQIIHTNSDKDWIEAAHSLKGTAAMIGATEMRDLCAMAQKSPDASNEEKEKMIEGIKIAYKKVCDELVAQGRYKFTN